MKPTYNKKYFFGTRKSDGNRIWLTGPSWDCGWYWGFGYLGNSEEHYHLNSFNRIQRHVQLKDDSYMHLTEGRNINMYDALLADYDLNPKIEENLWKFCELIKTAYILTDAAEVLGRGGAHYSTNPCADLIKNSEEVDRINNVVLPKIFDEIDAIFED